MEDIWQKSCVVEEEEMKSALNSLDGLLLPGTTAQIPVLRELTLLLVLLLAKLHLVHCSKPW